MNRIWSAWILPLAGMVLVSSAVAYALCGRFFPREVFAGWIVSLINAGAAFFLRRCTAAGGSRKAFWIWGLLGNGLRFLAVLAIVAAVIFLKWGHAAVFALTVVAGYLSFMTGDIVGLIRSGKNEQR